MSLHPHHSQYKYAKGQMVTILQVVCATQVDLHIRQAAAIHFKSVVVKDWDEEDRGEHEGEPVSRWEPPRICLFASQQARRCRRSHPDVRSPLRRA